MSYSDIVSDGGMGPRTKLDEAMYRHTVAQRDAAWREIENLREELAQLVERMGMQGFGTLAIAAAIRKGKV